MNRKCGDAKSINKSKGGKVWRGLRITICGLHNTVDIYGPVMGREGVWEIGCLGKSISFIGRPSSQLMSGEESSNGVRDTTSCFMSSHHPEVTAGLTTRSQPFNCCRIFPRILQMRESIISAAFYRSGIPRLHFFFCTQTKRKSSRKLR